jgi:hypothetical protein
MRHAFWTALLFATITAGLAAQSTSSEKKPPPAPPRPLTLTGCVEKGATPYQYTIADDLNGKYEVSGNDIKKYIGQRVQVAGSAGSTRFRVKGGLWPTPNVAAQAGDIDPAKAAIAAQPGGGATGTGEVALPTFKVKSIRSLDSSCR